MRICAPNNVLFIQRPGPAQNGIRYRDLTHVFSYVRELIAAGYIASGIDVSP